MGSRASILATVLPEIPERVGPLDPVSALPPEQERFRLYEPIALFLTAIAGQSPLVFLLDDLPWADAATCDLLTYVASRARSARLLLVGAFRDDEVEENVGVRRAMLELKRLSRLHPALVDIRRVATVAGRTGESRLLS